MKSIFKKLLSRPYLLGLVISFFVSVWITTIQLYNEDKNIFAKIYKSLTEYPDIAYIYPDISYMLKKALFASYSAIGLLYITEWFLWFIAVTFSLKIILEWIERLMRKRKATEGQEVKELTKNPDTST